MDDGRKRMVYWSGLEWRQKRRHARRWLRLCGGVAVVVTAAAATFASCCCPGLRTNDGLSTDKRSDALRNDAMNFRVTRGTTGGAG